MADLPSSRQGFWLMDNEYELETKVGEGRYAEVWKATERGTGKLLAVKVYKRGKEPKTDVGFRFIARHEELLLHACEGMVSNYSDWRQIPEDPLSLLPDLLQWGYFSETDLADTKIISIIFYMPEPYAI
jgi:serine/threonine protein kinase